MEKARSKNIALFPLMAQGHIIPFLALAQHIQKLQPHATTITFVSTPANIKNLRRSLSPHLSSSIKLAQLPFNSSDHGLPPDSENTDHLPHSLVARLVLATETLEPHFRKLLSTIVAQEGDEKQQICVVYDFFLAWAGGVARDLGVYHAVFSPSGGFGLACYASMWLHLPHREDEECVEFELPDFPEAGIFHVTQLTEAVSMATHDDPFTAFIRRNVERWPDADAMLFNTAEELDRTGLGYFRRKLGIRVRGIGPLLLPEEDRERMGRQSTISPEKCVDWLDGRETNSVVYISFGSQNTFTPSQMVNLAKALESTGKSFVWVVRPPLGFNINEEFVAENWLPEGFVGRVRDRNQGLIVERWAPQVEILRHRSTAAFVSHCGWNSVLEALESGVPIVGWPMAAEQFYNAKWLAEEVGVCVEVARGTSFEVREGDISDKIEVVLGNGEKGREIRKRCLEVKEVLSNAAVGDDGSSKKAMEEFFLS